ncbi:hypothetical protein Tco_0819680, partial [Tanacetum coccineum]
SMADMNIHANNVPTEHAPAVAPPTKTDDQILPSSKWMPIGKSNSMLDVQKSQMNPVFSIVVAILKNTNFFRAFTASSTIPAIYIQQFWDTIDALDITPTNDNNPFEAPPSSDTVIEAIPSMINMCLTSKTAGFDKPRHLVLHILWGITHHSNINYAERIWEEFFQSIQTFLTNRKNLATKACGKKKTLHLLILNVRLTKLIIHHLRTKHNIHPRTGSPLYYSHEESILNTLRFVRKDEREVFGMPIPDALLTDEITSAPYYSRYLEHVAEYQRCLDEEHGKAEEEDVTESPKAAKATKSKTAKQTKPLVPKASKVTKPPKPTPTTTEPSKKDQSKKRKLVKETYDAPSPAKRSKAGKVTKQGKPKSPLKLVDDFVDEGVPEQEPIYGDEEADIQRAVELSIKEQAEHTQGPAHPVVIREPNSGRIQPLPDVYGKGKDKRRTPTTTEPSGHAKSPSLYVELGLTDSETESDEKVSPEFNAGTQDEGQAGPKPSDQDEGQAGPNPGIQDEGQAGSNPGDAANLEHMDF